MLWRVADGCTDMDTGANMDSHSGTDLDSRAYLDTGTDLHTHGGTNMDPGSYPHPNTVADLYP